MKTTKMIKINEKSRNIVNQESNSFSENIYKILKVLSLTRCPFPQIEIKINN